MYRKNLLSIIMVFIMAGAMVQTAWASNDIRYDLRPVRRATVKYHNIRVAKTAGYGLVHELDYCFDNPGVGGMGYHLINTSLLDAVVDPLKPEALVYAPTPSGKLRLVAVEYIVPIDAWTATQPPMLFSQTFELNQALGVYALHAWIWERNPSGTLSDWNPKVSCN